MASNPRNMQIVGQKKLCTSNHTCNQLAECKKYPKRLNSRKFSFFYKATRTSTLKGNLKKPMMMETFDNFDTSSGNIIASSFWKTNLF